MKNEKRVLDDCIYKDYTEKINPKIHDTSNMSSDCVNQFIILMNYCFKEKNNFFIPAFNKREIRNVYVSYNQIKTNILTPEIEYIFDNLEQTNIKLLKFILSNFINNYVVLNDDTTTNNKILCEFVSKQSMKNCILEFNRILE